MTRGEHTRPDTGAATVGSSSRRGRGSRRRSRVPDPDELSDDEWYERGREVVLTKLDSRAHTRGELGIAMSRNGVPEQVQHQVLDRFEELGLVDDRNFAMQCV